MMIKFAPSILLSVLLCSDEVSAFNAVRPAVVRNAIARHSMTNNDFEADYTVEADRQGNTENLSASKLSRRAAIARFVAMTTAGTAFLAGNQAAMAVPEFSESPTSEASIARMGYDGKAPPAEPAASPAEEEPVTAKAEPVAQAPSKPSADFDGNEAGSVGATDEGSQPSDKKAIVGVAVDRSALDPANLPTLPGMETLVKNLSETEPKYVAVAGSVALLSVLTVAASSGDEEGGADAPASTWSPPPATPYGMDAGRNYWDGVDMNAAKQAGLVVSPPPPAAVQEVVVEEEAVDKEPMEEEELPSWALEKPTPYGLQNSNGSNPFITEVLEYCEGGKVSEPCAFAIKGFLDDIAETGAVAETGEAQAIAGYIDSLGEDDAEAPAGKKAGAAFTSYLDALSAGSAPPPSSAKAVKTYLDVMSGTTPAPDSEAAEPVTAAPQGPDFSEFDNRITNIEGRVTSLENKVDQIPDQVFAKVEAWQSSNEERLSAEVKKIVEALSAPAPVAEPVVFEAPPSPEPEPEPVVEVPVVEPEPEPATPVVQASPLAAIPMRSSMPQPMEGGGPKKGFGIGGGASWKTAADSSPAPSEPVAAFEPEPEPELVVEAAPIIPATPLAGVIPTRPSMPQAGSGPKKGYGFGGGGAWKTSESSSSGGGGYLDNMSP